MLAEILMLATSLPVLYYYYTMYEVNEKTRYLIGLCAGGWAFIGVFLIIGGIVGFSYFVIYIVIIVLVYLFEKIMGYLDEGFEEAEQEEYEIEWPVDVSNLTMAFLVLVVVILLYGVFLLAPVTPARVDDPSAFDEKGSSFRSFPDGYMYEYKYAARNSYVVVITLRSVPVTEGMISSALDHAKPEVEKYIRERYGQETELELRDEDTLEIDGHDAVKKTFDVNYRLTGTRIGVMILQAFYYHEDLETIVIGCFYPPTGESVTLGLIDDIVY